MPTSQPRERRRQSPPPPYRYYRTYGLTIASQLELPELHETAPATPDVEIVLGELAFKLAADHEERSWVHMEDDHCDIRIGNIARYRIEGGRRIQVDRRGEGAQPEGAAPGDVRLYLLGSALGALLHQRHWLPLHVSALQTPTGVWAFTGCSGAGKSTLAAWLHYRKDLPLVSDDVAAVRPGDEPLCLHPGPPRLKLWRDALAALGIDDHGLEADRTRLEKFQLRLSGDFDSRALIFSALVVLENDGSAISPSLRRLRGREAFEAVAASIYRPELGAWMNSREELFRQCARMAERVAVYRYRRPWGLDGMDAALEPLMQSMLGGEQPNG